MRKSRPDESLSIEMSARFHSNLAAHFLLFYDLYMVYVTDDASSFRILNSKSTYNAPLKKKKREKKRIFIRKIRALGLKYALLSRKRVFGANMVSHCDPYDYGARLRANKFQCGL